MPPGGDSGRGGEGEDTDEDVDFEDEMEAEERIGLQRNAKQLFLQVGFYQVFDACASRK